MDVGTVRRACNPGSGEGPALRFSSHSPALASAELAYFTHPQFTSRRSRVLSRRSADNAFRHIFAARTSATATGIQDAFTHSRRIDHGPDSRGHVGALPRTLRNDAGRCAISRAARRRPARFTLLFAPST